jgi:predicted SnoaL-like aldol condensation-catalyzing enzyme
MASWTLLPTWQGKASWPGEEEETPVSVEQKNKALVRRFLDEVYNRGNLDKADELLAAEYVDHTVPPGKYAGREGLKRSVAKHRASSSDLHISIEEQIAQGDKVVTWVIGSGTHDRERFMGLVPTGARMTMKHILGGSVNRQRSASYTKVDDLARRRRRACYWNAKANALRYTPPPTSPRTLPYAVT